MAASSALPSNQRQGKGLRIFSFCESPLLGLPHQRVRRQMAPTLIGDRTAPRIGGSLPPDRWRSKARDRYGWSEVGKLSRPLRREAWAGPVDTSARGFKGLVRRGFEPRQAENDPGKRSLKSLPRVA